LLPRVEIASSGVHRMPQSIKQIKEGGSDAWLEILGTP
jgi:hypothetical protein